MYCNVLSSHNHHHNHLLVFHRILPVVCCCDACILLRRFRSLMCVCVIMGESAEDERGAPRHREEEGLRVPD
jgi:hypothetical protein